MLIFDESNNAIMLDSIQGPVLSQYMYVLDLNMMDFTADSWISIRCSRKLEYLNIR